MCAVTEYWGPSAPLCTFICMHVITGCTLAYRGQRQVNFGAHKPGPVLALFGVGALSQDLDVDMYSRGSGAVDFER